MASVPYEWFTVRNKDAAQCDTETELKCSADVWSIKVDAKEGRCFVTLVRRSHRSTSPVDAVCFMSSCTWPVTFRVGQREEVPYCREFDTVVFYSRKAFSRKRTFKYVPKALSLVMGSNKMTDLRLPGSDLAFDFDVSVSNYPVIQLRARISRCFKCHPDVLAVYPFDFEEWKFNATQLKWGEDPVKVHEQRSNKFILVYIDLEVNG